MMTFFTRLGLWLILMLLLIATLLFPRFVEAVGRSLNPLPPDHYE